MKIIKNISAEFGFGCFKPVCITKVKYDTSPGVCKIISRSDMLGELNRIQQIIILTAVVYCSKNIQRKVSKEKVTWGKV